MKILLISPKEDKPTGGISVWTNAYLEGCAANGLDVTVVNTVAIGERAQNGSARRSLTDEISRTRRILRDLKVALRTDTFDVAHINTSCGTFGVIRDYLAARKIKRKARGAKIVLHYHCDIPYQIGNKLSRRYLKKLSSLADERIVLCESSRLYLEREFSLDSQKVPNFIDEKHIRTEEKAISPALERIFFVGRVSTAKGTTEIYELAKLFPGICFELVGAVSEEVAAWEKPENILLAGPMPHEEVLKRMDVADLFLFPSHSEGFSVALMEAMARGLPAVATDVGAGADMLSDGCGIIVPKGNIAALSDAIGQMQDPAARRAASEHSLSRVQDYTSDAVMRKLCCIYAAGK